MELTMGEQRMNGHSKWIIGVVGALLVSGFAFFYVQAQVNVDRRLQLVEDAQVDVRQNHTDIAVIKEQIRQINQNTTDIKKLLEEHRENER